MAFNLFPVPDGDQRKAVGGRSFTRADQVLFQRQLAPAVVPSHTLHAVIDKEVHHIRRTVVAYMLVPGRSSCRCVVVERFSVGDCLQQVVGHVELK